LVVRLFVAVDIDAATRAQLAPAREAIRRAIEKARMPARVTWVKDDAAHVTVRFIGETVDDRRQQIETALAAIRITPFDVRWETLGTFGGMRHPRVIWIAPTSGAEELRTVAKRVNDALDPVLGPGDARPFKPHLTLGRVREPGQGVDWSSALRAAPIVPTVSRVHHVTLYQSRLSPKGPTYTALSTHG
jgi:2'-5' RNA ligase